MRYSNEPRDQIYVKGHGLLSFAKNICKNLSSKCSQILLDSDKKSATDAIKTASKRAIQRTAGATGNLIDNRIADKITSVSKKSSQNALNTDEIKILKERYISPEKRQQIIDELRLA